MRPYFFLSLAICLVLAFSACEETQSASSVEDAEALLNGGDPAAAFAKAEALLEADANDMAAVYVAAQALHEMGDYAQSNFYLGEFLEAETTNGNGFYLRGLNYRALRSNTDAIKAFSTAAKYDPANLAAKECLLGYRYEDFDWENWLDRIWQLEQKEYQGGVYLGMIALRDMSSGKYKEGLEKAEAAMAQAPGEGMEWFKARILLEQGKPDAALTALRSEVENPFLKLPADELKGWAYTQLEQYDSVEICLERLRDVGRLERADQVEARMLVRQGYANDAMRLLLNSELNKGFRGGWVSFLSLYYDVDYIEGPNYSGESENRFHHEARCWNAYEGIQDGSWKIGAKTSFEKSKEEIKSVLVQNPNFALAHWMMGWVFLEEDEDDKACSSFQRAQSLNLEILYGEEIMDQVPPSCK